MLIRATESLLGNNQESLLRRRNLRTGSVNLAFPNILQHEVSTAVVTTGVLIVAVAGKVIGSRNVGVC